MVRLDHFAFPDDPETAFSMSFQHVVYQGPLGENSAWFIKGSRDTWVIILHGRRVGRREALRVLPTTHQSDFPILVITYMNDRGAPPDPSGYYRYGQTEWQDVEGAVQYAKDHGAGSIVLMAYSYGATLVMNFLYESSKTDSVTGVIFDSPLLGSVDISS